MAYLNDYKHDVLISYHLVERSWAPQLQKYLVARLSKKLGSEKINVLCTQDVPRQTPNPVLGLVQSTAILIPVLRTSGDCEEGLTAFLDQIRDQGVGNESSRIVPVLVKDLAKDKWPEAARSSAKHFSFFERDGGRIDPAENAFQDRLSGLVDYLSVGLSDLRRRSAPERATAPAVTPVDTMGAIFLAVTADDLRSHRRQLGRSLMDRHVIVAADCPPPYLAQEHAKATAAAVEEADLSIHLLGSSPGEPIEDVAERSYAVEQAAIGFAKAASQIVFLPAELVVSTVAESSYREFLEMMAEKARTSDKIEIIHSEKRQMTEAVLDKLREIRRPSVNGKRAAFLDVHEEDVPHAADLLSELASRSIHPLTLAPDLGPSQQRSRFEESFKLAQVYVVVFADPADQDWVEGRLDNALELIKHRHLQRRLCVYLAPPRKPLSLVPYRHQVDLVDGMQGFQKKSLEALDGILRKAYGKST